MTSPEENDDKGRPKSPRRLFIFLAAFLIAAALSGLGAFGKYLLNRDRVIKGDSTGRGRPDTWTTYDSRGHVIRFEKDRDGDGKPDWRDFYVFDEALGRERMVQSEIDVRKENRFDTKAIFNEKEELVRVERDRNGDGKLDEISYYENASRPPYKIIRDNDYNGSFEIEEKPNAP